MNLDWFRKKIGIVNQEPVLFANSIAENIAYGKDASEEEVRWSFTFSIPIAFGNQYFRFAKYLKPLCPFLMCGCGGRAVRSVVQFLRMKAQGSSL